VKTRRLAAIALAALVSETLVGSGLSRTVVFAAEQTVTGTVSDAACGKSHAGMPKPLSDRECTQDCASKGTPYVLVTDARIYKLTGHAGDLKAAAGRAATITGDVSGDTIRVTRVQR